MTDALPPKQYQYEGAFARSYESDRAIDAKWQREEEIVEDFLDRMTEPSMTVLDVPVGTGRFLPAYAKRGLKVIGVDVSGDMLAEARRRVVEETLAFDDIRLEIGNVTDLDLDTAHVDVAICIRLLNLIGMATMQSALVELRRVSSGQVIVGIRTHGMAGAARRLARRVRRLLRGEQAKLAIHSDRATARAIRNAKLRVVDKALVAKGQRNSSNYHIFLLDHAGRSEDK